VETFPTAIWRALPLIHTYRIVRRNSKYQPFLQMSELPVRRCGDIIVQ